MRGGGIPIFSIDALLHLDFDTIRVGTFTGFYEIPEQLCQMGIPKEKVDTSFIEKSVLAREAFLEEFAQEFQHLPGSLAELGVYRGDFARKINQAFPHKTLYLLDTFEGFAKEDLNGEKMGQAVGEKHFANTNVELVLGKMLYPQNCITVKGYFPQTQSSIKENETFLFVNLDVDLYAPTLAGLNFFYPKMAEGGVILIHEYFSKGYVGVKKAVEEFMKENALKEWHKMPIGDQLSIAIRKIPR